MSSRGHYFVVQHGEVAFLGFGPRDKADGLQKPAILEPVHPLESCELDGLEVAPRASAMDDFSFVETVDRFGEGVVPIPTKPPVCNGMIAPRDSWMMPPPVTRLSRPGRRACWPRKFFHLLWSWVKPF